MALYFRENTRGVVKRQQIKITGRVLLPEGEDASEFLASASQLSVKAYGIMELGPPLVLIGQDTMQISKGTGTELTYSITGRWPHSGFMYSHSAVVYAGLIGMEDSEPALQWVELKRGKNTYRVDIQL